MTEPRLSTKEIAALLRRVPLFQDLDDAALNLFARVAQLQSLAAEQYLFYQDDPGDAAYVVRSGTIAIVITTGDGRELVINELGAGECLGELSLLTNAPRSASAVARTDSKVLRLPLIEFLQAMERQPKLMRHILQVTAQRLRASTERERALAFLDTPARLARLLLELDRAASDKGYIMLAQDELAQRVGAARQTTAKILGEWRRAGWILTGRGKIVVLNHTALRRLSNSSK